jgi:hypothetical protein
MVQYGCLDRRDKYIKIEKGEANSELKKIEANELSQIELE